MHRSIACVVLGLAACGGEPPSAPGPDALRCVAFVRADAGTEKLAEELAAAARAGATLAVAEDPASLAVAIAATKAAPPPGLRVVGVADQTLAGGYEALVVRGDVATTAVELALLACHGVALPPKVALGVRVLTAANAAAGGTLRIAPGDIGFAMLKREHAALLTTKPTGDVVFRIGLVADKDDWAVRMHAAARAAAARYPQLVVEGEAVTQGPPIAVTAALRQRLDANVRVLVVALVARQPLADVAARAAELRIPIVAIDHALSADAACVVGCEPGLVARGLVDAVRAAAGGGAIALVEGDMQSRDVEDLARAFAAAAGWKTQTGTKAK